MNIIELRKKVDDGLRCHESEDCVCTQCPYNIFNDGGCSERLAADARLIINHYANMYESTLLQQPTMILHDPAPIRIEPVDVKATVKAIKAMNRMEEAAKRATDALDEASEAIRALKKELNEFDEK